MREFWLSFIFIFLAAVPGRTTFVLIILSASVDAWRIMIGATSAFIAQCAFAVLVGQALKLVPPAYVHLAAGLLFLYFARKFWLESRQPEATTAGARSIASIFTLFFLAELGDVSQLAIASRAAAVGAPLIVLAAAVCAMTTITLGAVSVGRFFGKFIDNSLIQKIASGVFLAVGAYLIVDALRLWFG